MLRALLCLLVLACTTTALRADGIRFWKKQSAVKLSAGLAGTLLDFTNNHGSDRRIFSPALDEKRDLYVYLPPGYDGDTKFPAMLYLHGLAQDEENFLDFVVGIDDAIRCGKFPPLVIVAPDGSVQGKRELFIKGSFYVNSKSGYFGTYIMNDVWGFASENFALRPEREARVIMGASMGGFGAYNLAFKHKDVFGTIVGIMPPLNLRYGDLKGNARVKYNPADFALRPITDRSEVLARFHYVVKIRSKQILDPLFGATFDPAEATDFISTENPYEMLTRCGIRPNDFHCFIGYGTRDEFNIDAECESFLDLAECIGIKPKVVVIPDGRHDIRTAKKMLPELADWLKPLIQPYEPPGYAAAGPRCAERATVLNRMKSAAGGLLKP